MPNYEYTCKCGKTFEERLPISDRNKKIKCACGKVATRSTFSDIPLHGFDKLGRSK